MSKSPDAFRTISEVADDLDLPQHVLRFWETRFNQIKPMKRGGGRRYYRPEDVDLLKGIKSLLYDEGYTIRGVQRLLKENGNRLAIDIGRGGTPSDKIPSAAAAPEAAEPEVDFDDDETLASPSIARGIISKLTKGSDKEPPAAGSPALDSDDVKALQATLQELLECKRLLDQTRQE